MTDNKNQNRRKKVKNSKNKNSNPKIKTKKRKTRLTRQYKENESEVQRLLEQASLSLDNSGGCTTTVSDRESISENLSQSIEFFCKEPVGSTRSQNRSEDLKVQRKMEVASSEHLSEEEEENSELSGADDEEEERGGDDEEGTTTSTSALASGTTRSSHLTKETASSIIQIELADAIITIPVVKYPVILDPNLLFRPAGVLNVNIQSYIASTMGEGSANFARLLNRYYEESGRDVKKLALIANALNLEQTKKYTKSKGLYRSICDHKFHPIFCEPVRDMVTIPTRKFMQLHIKELRFTDHVQLETEHRLANTLMDYYQAYAARLEAKICEKFEATLQTERKIVNDLLKREAEAEHQHDTEMQEQRAVILAEHLQAAQEQRTKLYEAEAENKRLLELILKTWMQLKTLRQEQAYQCTRFRLRFRVRDEENVTAARRTWQRRFETDLNELYREALESYYNAKRKWKQRLSSDYDLTELKRPKRPDIEKMAESLKKKLIESIGQPGEPKIEVIQSRLSDAEYFELLPENLQGGKGSSYFMKLYFDGQFVGMTRSYRLEPDFSLTMNEAIGIFLERRLPKDIKIKLYEKQKLPKVPLKIANIIVPLPLGSDTTDFQTQSISFSSHKQPISGRLSLRFECDESIYPEDVVKVLFPAPQDRTSIPLEMLKNSDDKPITGQQHLKQDTSADDDDDDDTQSEGENDKENKRSVPLQTCTFEEDLLKFCTMEELAENKRFRLLRSRYQKQDSRTRDLLAIPALDHELGYDGYDEQEEAVIDAGNWMNPIDLHKHEGKKYLKNLYECMRIQCTRLSKIVESSENLLIGDEPATLSSFFQALSNIFRPTRPLKPLRDSSMSRSKSQILEPNSMTNQRFNILLNVVRATGIPVRSNGHGLDSDSRQRSSGSSSLLLPQQTFKYSNVRPFVTLSYHDKLCRTTTAEGSNPTWNEQLTLQLNENFEQLREDIKISLFDEVIESHINDDDTGTRNMDVYQRIQANWLGEYRIPISTLLASQKFEGVFELNTPKILLGYQRPRIDSITSHSATSISVDQIPEIKEAVYLWFYISIEPSFELPRLGTKCLECSELREVREQLHFWSLNVRELQPKRFIDPLVCTADGKRVCITRLLEGIPLPIEATENLLDSACRYVALLSVLKSYDACTRFDGVWLNNKILLDTTWGTPKDLGVVLANFIISIDMACGLVLCNAHPYGQSAFVLYQNNEEEFMLVDPCTGRRYYASDLFCPISKVDVIVARDNIYCNIQVETRIAMMNFNVNDTACWLPAFSKRSPAPTGGVQHLNYDYKQAFNTAELRKNIERKIMKKISTWRAMRKTIWNRAFQMRLLNILQELEGLATFGNSPQEHEESKYAKQLIAEFPNYKLYGFTLNFAYTNLSSISERIKSTGLHLNSNKNVEFSLAVHIHAYKNNLLSVWVFLISLVPSENV